MSTAARHNSGERQSVIHSQMNNLRRFSDMSVSCLRSDYTQMTDTLTSVCVCFLWYDSSNRIHTHSEDSVCVLLFNQMCFLFLN